MLWHPVTLLLLVTVVVNSQQVSQEPTTTKRPTLCGRAEKRKFNENLMDLFRAEYGKEVLSDLDTQKILNWKFASLDKNDDNYLQRPEYRSLKKLKRLVKPKKCAKTFARTCDRDRDSRISREEWSSCMGVDLMVLRSSDLVSLSEHKRWTEEPEPNDCLSDRKTVLSEQRANELYVPECAPDGRYNRIQCYKSTGYCWCVREDDGEPVPGTSVKDATPDCDAMPTPPRPIKGCPSEKKEAFLNDLAEFMAVNKTQKNLAEVAFASFDANANKFLDRNEWKTFRTVVAAQKNLRRCGKRLPRFCDVNNDRRISITEWSTCLAGFDSKRRGKNPLQTILKDD